MHRKPLPDWDDVSLEDMQGSISQPLPQFRGIAASSTPTVPTVIPTTDINADVRRERLFKSELARDRMSPIHFRKSAHTSFVSSASPTSLSINPTNPPIAPVSQAPPSDIYPQSQILQIRERLLHVVAAVTTLITASTTIDKTVTTTATLDTKLLTSLFQFPSAPSSAQHTLPELESLENKVQSLTSSLKKCFLCLAEQFVVAERTYKQQLLDLRGISNQATRNALLSEKASLTSRLITLQEQHDQDMSTLRKELDTATTTIHHLEHALEEQRDKTATASDAAVVIAQQYEEKLAKIAVELEKQVSVRLEAARNDVRGRDDIYEKRIEDIKQSYESQLRLLKEYHTEQMTSVSVEVRNKDNTEKQLRQQISTLQEQLNEHTINQDKVVSAAVSNAVAQAKKGWDQHLSDLEEVLAKSKLEIAELKEKLHAAAQSHEDLIDIEVSKQRNMLISRHQEEMLAVNTKHNQEIRKIKALVDVKASELNVKSKRLYEQEITRLVAENDRLRRQLARSAGTTSPATTKPTPASQPTTYSYSSHSPRIVSKNTPVGSAPATPILRSTAIPSSSAPSSRWGQMSVSMLRQEQEDAVSPPSSPPPTRKSTAKVPHAFPLEVAFQSSLKSNGSIGEQQNIVGRYMGQLQKYIEGQPITTTDSIFDESNSLLRPRGVFSSSSSDNSGNPDDRDDDSLE